MKLGNFFEGAATCTPINPKPFTFTAIAKGLVLPGGTKNNTGGAHRATVTAAFAALSGEETATARLEARRALRDRAVDEKTKEALPFNETDFGLELIYHLLTRAVREWDAEEHKTGGPLFASVALARELLTVREANRIYDLYIEYVAEEHPEVALKEPFRGAQDGNQTISA